MSPRALFRAGNPGSIRICPASFRKIITHPTALAPIGNKQQMA
jgi:hypothetical protein